MAPVPLKKTTSIVTDSETVKKFVFTGGPCGGKTTSLERVRAFLVQYHAVTLLLQGCKISSGSNTKSKVK